VVVVGEGGGGGVCVCVCVWRGGGGGGGRGEEGATCEFADNYIILFSIMLPSGNAPLFRYIQLYWSEQK
jgi:hypothetical protein